MGWRGEGVALQFVNLHLFGREAYRGKALCLVTAESCDTSSALGSAALSGSFFNVCMKAVTNVHEEDIEPYSRQAGVCPVLA